MFTINAKWAKRLTLSGHTFIGGCILVGGGAAATALLGQNAAIGRLAEAVLMAQGFLVVGAVNLYIMVKTPFRDVISSSADMLEDIEKSWRAGTLTDDEAILAQAAATETSYRVLSIMLFAGLGLATVIF